MSTERELRRLKLRRLRDLVEQRYLQYLANMMYEYGLASQWAEAERLESRYLRVERALEKS